MAKFLTGNELNTELEKIFESAEELLVLISPYIKLHDRYISVLKSKMNNPELQIVIVFGKNEDDFSRSMRQEDFNFFKEFPNIEIRYEKRLHAKYYANDFSAILTSMNLYSFSQDNNIEAGVMTKVKLFNNSDSLDGIASNYFQRVIEQSELLFQKVPQFESKMMGLTKKYTESVVEVDELTAFFEGKPKLDKKKRNVPIVNKQPEKILNTIVSSTGYCIRTGKQIPFNPKKPLCDEAYQSWLKFKNEDYKEKYCHFSGEESFGETTFAKPILRKNWSKAKELFEK